MNFQYLLLTVVVVAALFFAYSSTKAMAADIKRLEDENKTQPWLISEILAQEATDYLVYQESILHDLPKGDYDESRSNN